jgi:hypothetical protein
VVVYYHGKKAQIQTKSEIAAQESGSPGSEIPFCLKNQVDIMEIKNPASHYETRVFNPKKPR